MTEGSERPIAYEFGPLDMDEAETFHAATVELGWGRNFLKKIPEQHALDWYGENIMRGRVLLTAFMTYEQVQLLQGYVEIIDMTKER